MAQNVTLSGLCSNFTLSDKSPLNCLILVAEKHSHGLEYSCSYQTLFSHKTIPVGNYIYIYFFIYLCVVVSYQNESTMCTSTELQLPYTVSGI